MALREPDWQSDDGGVRLYCADAREVLPALPDKVDLNQVISSHPLIRAQSANVDANKANIYINHFGRNIHVFA